MARLKRYSPSQRAKIKKRAALAIRLKHLGALEEVIIRPTNTKNH